MTTISLGHGARARRTTTTGIDFGGLARRALRFAGRIQAEISRRRTERMLEGLPLDIRKDIGWPSPEKTTSSAPAATR